MGLVCWRSILKRCLEDWSKLCDKTVQENFEVSAETYYHDLCDKLCEHFKIPKENVRLDFAESLTQPYFGENKEALINFCTALVGKITNQERAYLKRDGTSVRKIALILMRNITNMSIGV